VTTASQRKSSIVWIYNTVCTGYTFHFWSLPTSAIQGGYRTDTRVTAGVAMRACHPLFEVVEMPSTVVFALQRAVEQLQWAELAVMPHAVYVSTVYVRVSVC
jgi:hypothetical protein